MEKNELKTYKQKLSYDLSQLELDYYQHLVLSKLYEKFNTIYFKGGTCLQKCYGIKRFSDDLDFNYVDTDINKIIAYVEGLLGAKINDYHKTRFGVTFGILFEGILYDGNPQSKCRISFDFREGDTYKKLIKRMIRPIYADLNSYFLLALSEEEIAAEKIRTIMTRYKARDVYDLNELILNGVNINFDLVDKKLKSYDLVFSEKIFKEKIEEKRNIYEEEMKRLTKIYSSFEECKRNILKAISK